MAKYAKNINKQIRLLDVQKQFPGGLKTVDTDDALGKVYLREAENVSLSEFSFLEKRYGTAVEKELGFATAINNVDFIQGYFEFQTENGIDKILFVDGVPYIKTWDAENYSQATTFFTEEGFVYPDFQGTDVFENFELSLAQDNYNVALTLTSTGLVISDGSTTQAEINPVALELTIDSPIGFDIKDVIIVQFGSLNLTLTISNTIIPTIIEEEYFGVAFNDLALSLSVSDYVAISVENYGVIAKLENITSSDIIGTSVQFEIVSQQGYSNQTTSGIGSLGYTIIDNTIPGDFQYNLSINAPSTFVQGQDTYSFVRFRVNGVLQTNGQNTFNANYNENVQIEAQYGSFGF